MPPGLCATLPSRLRRCNAHNEFLSRHVHIDRLKRPLTVPFSLSTCRSRALHLGTQGLRQPKCQKFEENSDTLRRKVSDRERSIDFAWSSGSHFRERFGFKFRLYMINYPCCGGPLNSNGSSLGNVAYRFRTTRWIMVLRSAQSQAPGFQAALGKLRKQDIAVVREEVGRTVSDPAEIEEESPALCDALTASEGRLEL
jgi:hypothetical protein